jgi:NOL1/NOP2/sun family putative RNA methylase
MVFEQYGDLIPDFAGFQESLSHPLPTHLRINTLKATPASVLRSMGEEGRPLEQSLDGCQTLYGASELSSPGHLLEYFLGHIHPQALTSCLASMALSPQRGSYVLDLCAAPGGKTSHMAAIMANEGLIIANELHSARRIALGHTLDRLGVTNTVVTGYPAQQFPMNQRFDYVLADVPCSGEGTFRHTGRAQTHGIFSRAEKLQSLQKQIVLRAFDLLSENGVLLYSTCTYNPAENEGVLDHLLRNRDVFVHTVDWAAPCEAGVREWKGEFYDTRVQGAARFYPHRLDSVGFFMARIGRTG